MEPQLSHYTQFFIVLQNLTKSETINSQEKQILKTNLMKKEQKLCELLIKNAGPGKEQTVKEALIQYLKEGQQNNQQQKRRQIKSKSVHFDLKNKSDQSRFDRLQEKTENNNNSNNNNKQPEQQQIKQQNYSQQEEEKQKNILKFKIFKDGCKPFSFKHVGYDFNCLRFTQGSYLNVPRCNQERKKQASSAKTFDQHGSWQIIMKFFKIELEKLEIENAELKNEEPIESIHKPRYSSDSSKLMEVNEEQNESESSGEVDKLPKKFHQQFNFLYAGLKRIFSGNLQTHLLLMQEDITYSNLYSVLKYMVKMLIDADEISFFIQRESYWEIYRTQTDQIEQLTSEQENKFKQEISFIKPQFIYKISSKKSQYPFLENLLKMNSFAQVN